MQGCMTSPKLSIFYMDGVVGEVYKITQKGGLKIIDRGQRVACCQLLFTLKTALVAESAEYLYCLLKDFGRVFEREKLRVNVYKNKVMMVR